MSQTFCERCSFPGPIRWLHAGGDLSRPSRVHQRAHRALVRSERPPKSLMHSTKLPYLQTRRPNTASATSIVEVGAGVKSP